MYRKIIMAAVAATMLGAITACDNTAPSNPAQDAEQTSVEETDTTGEVGPYLRPNGKLGTGIDMGGGFNYNISNGKVEYSPFGF